MGIDVTTLALAKKFAREHVAENAIGGGATTGMLEAAISLEAQTRHDEIAQAVTLEADARQGQVEALNAQIQATNEVLEGVHTVTLNSPLPRTVGEIQNVALDSLTETLRQDRWMPGKTQIFDINGTQGVYIGGAGGPRAGIDPLPIMIKSFSGSETDGEYAKRSDGFLLRLSREAPIQIASGSRASLLATFSLANNVLLSANTTAANWQLNSGALVFPAWANWMDCVIDIRLSGTMGGGQGSIREFSIELVRDRDNSVAAEQGVIKVANPDLSSKAIIFESYTIGADDPFIDGGVRIELNNTAGQAINLTRIDVVIKCSRH